MTKVRNFGQSPYDPQSWVIGRIRQLTLESFQPTSEHVGLGGTKALRQPSQTVLVRSVQVDLHLFGYAWWLWCVGLVIHIMNLTHEIASCHRIYRHGLAPTGTLT